MKLLLSILATCIFIAVPAGVSDGQTEFTGKTMGPIVYRVVVNEPVDNIAEIRDGIQSQLDHVNERMSTYRDDSDVSRINQAEAGKWISVNPMTFKVVARAIELAELTDGAFDITIGPAVNRWKFGPDAVSTEFPTDAEIEELQAYVGIDKIEVRDDSSEIRKLHDHTEIDLSAIAKGFAVDHVANWLTDQGYKNFMAEIGGEIVVRGKGPKGEWRIGIERPDPHGRSVAAILELTNTSIATSGDYRNVRMYNGKPISHTIDPKTCRPVENPPASCSVVAKDCMTADAIATAVMVMGAKQGLKFCEQNDFELNVYSRSNSDSSINSAATKNFPSQLNAQSAVVASQQQQSIWPAFIGALVVFSLAVAGMAVGAIFNNRPIRGSCGGIASSEDGTSACSLCEKPVAECPDQSKPIS